jgi:uncharacterized protein YuzE
MKGNKEMEITYDKEIDAMMIYLRKNRRGIYSHTIKVTEWFLLDVDKRGNIYGIEILDSRRHFPDKVIMPYIRKAKILSAKPLVMSL